MNDFISRQAAIDALDGKIEITGRTNAEAVKGYVRLVKDRLERLPSAQPDVPDTNVGDCISRQAVVKFFNDWISCLDENCHHQSNDQLNYPLYINIQQYF